MKHNLYCHTCKDDNIDNLLSNGISPFGVHRYICRKCNTERLRKYRKTKIGIENTRKAVKKSTLKHAVKQNARITLSYYVKIGRVIKLPCEICGEIKVDGHHDDYGKPLEVKWLCRKHHADLHKELKKLKS